MMRSSRRGPLAEEGLPMANVAIVGSGAWGTALGAHAARLDHAVHMWALEPPVVEDVNTRHVNTLFLPDVPLPESLRATLDPAAAVSAADLVVLVPPSRFLRSVSALIAPHLAPGAIVVVATKGIEEGTLTLMSEVLAETLPGVGPDRVAFLSGPSFAREVAHGLPTDVVVGSHRMIAARAVQRLIHSPAFRVYTSADPIGVQVGGAVKNVIAVAAGACDALHLGTNARAALIARGLAEITRLGVALGANPLTFLGMAGVGDLVLTCTGPLSRNRTLGTKLAEGMDARAYLASVRSVAEGFSTAAAAYELAQKLCVDMPITEQVYHVLHQGRPLVEALKLLVTRAHKDELMGIEEPSSA
jgi:glycerol-3-phosphate dehydrogenase (NAD(P)+)